MIEDASKPTAERRAALKAWDHGHFVELEASGVVVVTDRSARIVAVSEGCEVLVGRVASDVVGETVADVLGDDVARAVEVAVDGDGGPGGWRPSSDLLGASVRLRTFRAGDGLVGVDLVPVGTAQAAVPGAGVELVAEWNEWFSRCTSSKVLLDVVVSTARERLGFDGVWIQRNEPGGTGVVVAADAPKTPDVVGRLVAPHDLPPSQPRVGDRFQPYFVEDLAVPGRRLWPPSSALDLQASALLRPFPQYLEEKAALGVRATAGLPLVVDGQLWGRVICHSAAPRAVSSAVQSELRLLAAAASVRLAELIAQEDAQEQLPLAQHSLRIMANLTVATDALDALAHDARALLGVCDADAAIIWNGGRLHTHGLPDDRALVDALSAAARAALTGARRPVASTTRIDDAAGVDPHAAAGFLAARLGAGTDDIVVWLRRLDAEAQAWVQHQLTGDPTADQLFTGLTVRTQGAGSETRPWTRAQLAQVEELRQAIAEQQVTRSAQLRAANAELQRSNEQYDAFAHAAAHDLRAPLRGIILNAEFLLEDLVGRLTDGEVEQLETIKRLTGRMTDLLEGLMTYAQIGQAPLVPETLALTQVTSEVVELLGVRVPEEATLTVARQEFVADPAALRQILLNVIGNAIKYGRDHPQVAVDVTTLGAVRETCPPPATLDSAPDSTAILRVADNGIGIHPDHHERIFGLFRQLDPDSSGTGAGLAICRLISHRHAGEIWLSSVPGQGTTFYLAMGTTSELGTR